MWLDSWVRAEKIPKMNEISSLNYVSLLQYNNLHVFILFSQTVYQALFQAAGLAVVNTNSALAIGFSMFLTVVVYILGTYGYPTMTPKDTVGPISLTLKGRASGVVIV